MHYKRAYVEITNRCNLRCSFCPPIARAPAFMSPERFAQTARQIRPLTDWVYLHLMGEPLLHPQLDEILKICEILEFKAAITTNGTLLQQRRDLLLGASSLCRLQVSLHSFEANGQPGPLCDYLHTAADTARALAERGTVCILRLWNMDSGELRGENRLNCDIIELLEGEFCCAFSLRQMLSQGQSGIKLAPRIYLEMAERFQWPSLTAPILGTEAFCTGLREQFGVLVDGTVVPCCFDSEGAVSLGNLFSTPLKQILLSRRAERICEGFTARRAVELLCRRCGRADRTAQDRKKWQKG